MEWIVPVVSTLVGLIIGSFLNVVIFRFSQKSMTVFKPARSICISCKKPIPWYDNIPILSFALLKGRCRYCQARLSGRYPFVEALTAACFLIISLAFSFTGGSELLLKEVAFFPPFPLMLIGADVLVAALIVVFFTDLDTMLISDATTAFVIAGCALLYLDQGLRIDRGIFIVNLITAFIAFSLVYILRMLFKIFAKKDAMGMVDIVLISALALALGPMKINLAVFLSCFVGIIAAIFFQKKMQDKIPFGPFIAVGGYIAFIVGDAFLDLIGFMPYF
ncbi:MAG: prepilin peptidase [Thermotogota bacterium]|nr:prepilin peptidase [Thermotogota bacterium]